MDDGYARAVLEVFVRLLRAGLHLPRQATSSTGARAARRRSPTSRSSTARSTTCSTTSRYHVEGGGEIVVATVRPVTILADTAVAVHPDDPRYRDLVGTHARSCRCRPAVPIIADARRRAGLRHGRAEDHAGPRPGRLRDRPPPRPRRRSTVDRLRRPAAATCGRDWEGLDRSRRRARARRGASCARAGRSLARSEPYRHSRRPLPAAPARASSRSSRCSGSAAWTSSPRRPSTSCATAACASTRAQRQDLLRLDGDHPPLVHLAPAVVGPPAAGLVRARRLATCVQDRAAARATAGSSRDGRARHLVLVGALALATLGWPEDTPELRRWYPGNVLSTARDIINLWVARMIMTGLEFAGDVPFTDVYIHSTIQAADGRRMSKSLGTGIDPLELIDRVRRRRDPLRADQDVARRRTCASREGMIDEGARLRQQALERLPAACCSTSIPRRERRRRPAPSRSTAGSSRASTSAIEHGHRATTTASTSRTPSRRSTRFVWNDVCDWYLEALKLRLYGDDPAAQAAASETALYVLERMLALLHPVMPFVTEEIWASCRTATAC